MKVFAILLFMVLALAPGTSWSCERKIPEKFLRLVQKNPEQEAESALHSGRAQFLAVQGYATETPGAPGVSYCWLQAGLATVLDDTTDVVCSQAQRDFKKASYSFASRFNKRLFELSVQFQKHACAT
jgi:hypothetical protein